MVIQVISPSERVQRARERVEAMRGEVVRLMRVTDGTTHPEEVLPAYEAAVVALANAEAAA